uniref:Uncharacterized protein n=1 Tax=Macaca fascicularis TaxID=9541 RepID=A0A7N9CUG1_MACFA
VGQAERCQEERPGASGAGRRELRTSPQGGANRQPRHARGHLRLSTPQAPPARSAPRSPTRLPAMCKHPARPLPCRPIHTLRPHHFQPHRSRCIYFP